MRRARPKMSTGRIILKVSKVELTNSSLYGFSSAMYFRDLAAVVSPSIYLMTSLAKYMKKAQLVLYMRIVS